MNNLTRFEDLISEELTAEDQATIAGGTSFKFNDELVSVENSSFGDLNVIVADDDNTFILI